MPTSMGWGTISFTTRSSAQNCQIDFLESRNQSRVVSHRRCTTLSICSTTREIRIDRMKMATRLIGCRSIGMGTMASRKVQRKKRKDFRQKFGDLKKQDGVHLTKGPHVLGFLDPARPKRGEGRGARVEAIELIRPGLVW